MAPYTVDMIRVDLTADEFGRFLEMHSKPELGLVLDGFYYTWASSQGHPSDHVAAAVIQSDGTAVRWVRKDLVEDAVGIKVASRRKKK